MLEQHIRSGQHESAVVVTYVKTTVALSWCLCKDVAADNNGWLSDDAVVTVVLERHNSFPNFGYYLENDC